MRQVLYAVIVSLFLLQKTLIGADAEALPMDEKIFKYTLGDYCLDKSYKAAVGKDKSGITTDREEDWRYNTTDSSCCCTDGILDVFKEKTKDITNKRVNPAVDKLIEALRNQRMASDDKIKELVHLKYVNTLYSFFDKTNEEMKSKTYTMPDEDGCIDVVTFRKLEKDDLNRNGVYREGILKETLSLLHAWKKSVDMIAEKNMIKVVK